MSLMYYTIMSLVQHLVILLLPQSGRAAGRRVSECAPSAEVMDAATQDPDLLVGGGGEGGGRAPFSLILTSIPTACDGSGTARLRVSVHV